MLVVIMKELNLEVVKTILKALNKPESLIKFVEDRKGHDRRYAIDPTKLETELRMETKIQFRYRYSTNYSIGI